MKTENDYNYPNRIICLTEESVETLYLLGKQELIVGVSAFVKRPKEALKLPKVSFFTSSNYDKIAKLQPDLILGHSDIQKDIARELIELGHNVFIANHRGIQGILKYITLVSRLVDESEKGKKLVLRLLSQIAKAQEFSKTLDRKPKVYFEEWDEPQISAIRWVSELIELCGGIDINAKVSKGNLAKERFVTDKDVIKGSPDIIFGCWCGKKVKINKIKGRAGYENLDAIKNDHIFELQPEIFLQPGPAPLLDGIEILIDYFDKWNKGTL